VIRSIPVGPDPVGVAVSPDGGTVCVVNRLGNSVTLLDTATVQLVSTIAVDIEPTGIAISPDGRRAFVANRGSNTVSVIDLVSGLFLQTVPVGLGPVGIAISPDGKRAYVTHSAENSIGELGGPMALTIMKEGTGIGAVTSSPDGIACGATCRASFEFGWLVTLTAVADSGSTFTGWAGDPDCADGTVVMNTNKICTATFQAVSTGGGGGGGSGGGGGCFIATAAYGSYLHPHVQVLREFRDARLLSSRTGQKLVALYYRHSPPVAEFLQRHENFRTTARFALTPIVYAIKYPTGALFLVGLMAVVVTGRLFGKEGDGHET
jgi:YVTN family beta-propeller protein